MTLPDFKGSYMPSMIPAAPGTYIVELGETDIVLKTPVVAWAPDAENPYRSPFPITVCGLSRLLKGRAILHPCGMVHDRDFPLCFESVEEWAAYAAKGPRTPPPTEREEAEEAEEAEKPTKAQERDADQVAQELRIEWTTKPFKSNSWYRYTDGDLDFIFQVDGGVNPPKQKAPVEKIKRDEFMALKKTVDVADLDKLMAGVAPGLDDLGSFEEDDDDDDLVGGSNPDDDDDDDLI